VKDRERERERENKFHNHTKQQTPEQNGSKYSPNFICVGRQNDDNLDENSEMIG
jgi:hypothetical protein